MHARTLAIATFAAGAIGCNAIFGIQPGKPSEGTGGGGTGGTTVSTGTTGGGGAGAACLPDRPDTCEPGTLDEPENCCVAGRSCQGGTCQSGECGPVQIGASPSPVDEELLDVAVSGDRVFWASGYGNHLYMTSIDGGPVFTHATSNDAPDQYITRLDADATHVYYTNWGTGRIVRVAVAGGGLEIVAEVPNNGGQPQAGFGQIAVGGGHVFWAMENTGGVYHVSLGDMPADAVLIDANGNHGVATDGEHVYWGTGNSTILRAPLSDLAAPPQTVVSDQGVIDDLEVIGDRVYWAGYGSLQSAVKDGQNKLIVTLYSEGGPSVHGIAGDGRDVFFTTAGSSEPPIPGYLYRAPALGGARVELAKSTSLGPMRAVVMDCDTVYVANSTDLTVFKLTR
jgi:hypothetical protein